MALTALAAVLYTGRMSDDDIVQQRIKGRSVRAIAKSHGISLREVNEVLEQWSGNFIDDRIRKVQLALEIERLDQVQAAFFEQALDGDVQSGLLVAKIVDRRCQILGLTAATQHVLQVIESNVPRQTSTDKLEAVLADLEAMDDATVEAKLKAIDASTH